MTTLRADQAIQQADAARIAAEWNAVAVVEGLSDDVAANALRPLLRAEYAHADETLERLPPWSAIPDRVYRVSTAVSNHVRSRRVMDFVLPGERIADIGINYGYLSGLILRDRRPAHYAGFDLAEHQLSSLRQLVEEQELRPASIALNIADIYDFKRSTLATHQPDLVLLLEVLEHVPDAERALATVAHAMGKAPCILFTVPLFGRHDTCWGHWSVFDAARVQRMCEGAGLSVHHVECVHNAWLFVLAGKGPLSAARRAAIFDGGWPTSVRAHLADYRLERVSAQALHPSMRWRRGLQSSDLTAKRGRATATATADGGNGSHYFGMTFDIPGFRLVRLELEASGAIAKLYVDALSESGARLARWSLNPANGDQLPDGPFTSLLRSSGRAGPLVVEQMGPLTDVRSLEIFARLHTGGTGSISVRRAAVLPDS